MVKCSTEVVAHNGFGDFINIIPKRSTDITVGPYKDMEQRANVLITEVFDTELIGEGAIGTFNHANQHLLTVKMNLIMQLYSIISKCNPFIGRFCCYPCPSYYLCSVNRV
jgi:hypothetical protein